MITRRAALVAGTGALAAPALAQGSAGTIRIIVPFPPGGSVDTVSRLMQPHLQASLGANILVENRGGASGALGTAQAARAAPDGQTFLMVFDTHATNPSLIPNLGFDTRRDLAPVWLLGTAPNMLLVHRNRPWTSLAQVLDAARAQPDRISCGTIGNGSLAHLGMVLAQRAGRFSISHVPYRGGGPLATAAMAGETDLYAATGTIFVEHLRQGVLRPLAVLGPRRRAHLPDVPTMAEAGLPGVEAEAFWGMLAPSGTPAPIIARMEEACRRATEVPEVRERLTGIMGIEMGNSSGAEFGRFLDRQITTWARVIGENNIRPD
ncbi:Bug family tripartite tricarboxylate transporter substrate binding protein [Sabulicella glaciei]|uniref:Tripartite tricarboxylate transporter substrate-binding protein n=1 Tax=Sabulicella glaciei TaxID=2984948 RepID=A0ABT3NW52_9PROT|nr:tripartite tricarboxylate transporter substrate-binding protein [Roseococcus sp. MDT2-1-1]MCW8086396.1 tripartite tricarboxylate transporter substrate-binding protein [Roseococcus sp. MDT2-1-1]